MTETVVKQFHDDFMKQLYLKLVTRTAICAMSLRRATPPGVLFGMHPVVLSVTSMSTHAKAGYTIKEWGQLRTSSILRWQGQLINDLSSFPYSPWGC